MEINSLDTRSAILSWPVFYDGHVRRFLVVWIEQQVARLGKTLETATEAELKKIQGQISAFRVTLNLLESNNIAAIVSDLPKV